MAENTPSPGYERFGGDLPLGCDPLLPEAQPEAPDVLGFSHGRAALGWLIEQRGPFETALVCAYTCPTVPRFLRGLGLKTDAFDAEAPPDEILTLAQHHPGRLLVLLPALFGLDPWLDAEELATALGERALVVIDAAQTGFGHRRYRPPSGGAVLSCPRKATALAEGACLVLTTVTENDRCHVAALPEATAAAVAKHRAHALLAERDPARETEALALSAWAEAAWPSTPHRMSLTAWLQLSQIDAETHALRRLTNRARLASLLEPTLPTAVHRPGVPFCHPVLTDTRTDLLRHLHTRRIFATPLWPDSEHNPTRHPRAAAWTRQLLALPVDQRNHTDDMERLGRMILLQDVL